MGAYKPHFSPMPDNYYPTSVCDIILIVLFLLLIVGGGFGATVGFLIWSFQIGNSMFVLIWSIVLIVFLVVMFVGVFFGGKSKLRYEKEMIRTKVQQLKDSLIREATHQDHEQ
jgi:hypothetical protein